TLRMDAGKAVTPLDHETWRERGRRWLEQEGSFDSVFGPPPADAAWHESCARVAEEAGNTQAALWHLDRLLAARSRDSEPPAGLWLLHARRARALALQGRFEQANEAMLIASAGAPDLVQEWEGHQLVELRLRREGAAARWYADRLIVRRPGDWKLYAER